ncbi:DUF3987 domain-containing protein [Spirosoma sp.]|uniref:DUF3987 domain-containing protein n=1 Tax=Spirosoma sp. TaxID=1899569 RepID=UPI00261CBBDE|nr:DUF3987 domain-containing protein [Spirosoma sp.]MCX6214558.1 DUF3987 domain-containing protein [Spirosoma sp.]
MTNDASQRKDTTLKRTPDIGPVFDFNTWTANQPETVIPIEDLQQETEPQPTEGSNVPPQGSFQTETETPETEYFTQAIFNNLPDTLKNGCSILTDRIEKEVFLVGALGVVSGLLPNVRGFYDTRYYSTNLYCYVLARYGSGKGALSLSYLLGAVVHRRKKEQYQQALTEYKADLARYKKDLKAFQADKKGLVEEPTEPAEPPLTVLFIPANNSRTGAFELLNNNEGRGIIFETEGDTLADSVKQDYGNYSDGLRKAFHHESITYYRRTGKEYCEIENPEMSVVLSSTFDQLLNLMPTAENGLFSRFLFYNLTPNPNFKNVFDSCKSSYPAHFGRIGEQLAEIYDHLVSLAEPLTIRLTPDQEGRFIRLFQHWKDEIREFVSEDLDGSVNRLGLIAFRIAMMFTTLRAFDTGEITDMLTCSDLDFDNALKIVEMLKRHVLRLYNQIPKPKKSQDTNKFSTKSEQLEKARKLYSQGKNYAEIAADVLGDAKRKGTIWKWLNA